MKSKLIILGCGSSIGVPSIDGFWGKCNKNNKRNFRTRCSAAIIKGKNSILIDASPDIRMQLLNNKIKDISSVIFTHEHADQVNGLFELRPFFWKHKKKIKVFGNLRTVKYLKRSQYFLFKESNTSYPAIIQPNIVKTKFSLGNLDEKISFKTIDVKHGKTRSLGYIFENCAYISDCNDLSIANAQKLKKLKYLIIDCLKLRKHPTHFNLDDALYVHRKLNPEKTVLTNLHHDLDYDFLLKRLPKNVLPAYDGLQIQL